MKAANFVIFEKFHFVLCLGFQDLEIHTEDSNFPSKRHEMKKVATTVQEFL